MKTVLLLTLLAGAAQAGELEAAPDRGAWLAGFVVDPQDRPLEGASVEAFSQAPWHAKATSDEHGRFELRGVPAGLVRLQAHKDGYDSVTDDEARAGAADLRLVLVPQGAVSGRARAADGSPLSAMEVSARRSPATPGLGPGRTPSLVHPRVIAVDDGSYVIECVSAGTWDISFRTSRQATVRVEGLNVEAGLTTRGVDLVFDAGRGVSGIVVSRADGAPVGGAEVLLANPGTGAARRGPWADPALGGVRSDASGGFRLEGLPDGEVTLLARHPEYSDTEMAGVRTDGPDEPFVRIELGSGGRIEGQVRDAAGPVPGASASLWQRSMRLHAIADGEGGFVLDGVTPGSYDLHLSDGRRRGLHRQVEVAEGETLRLALELGSRRLSGRVLRAGEPQPGMNLNFTRSAPGAGDASSASATTDAEGRYAVEGVEPGAYRVTLASGVGVAAGLVRLELELGDGLDQEHDFILPRTSIRGRISASPGAVPLAGIQVEARRAADRSRVAHAETRADGSYELRLAQPGAYDISVLQSSHPTPVPRRLDVPDVGLDGVDFELREGAALRGRVTGPEGQAIGGARVRVGLDGTRTDASGLFTLVVSAGRPVSVLSVSAPGFVPQRLRGGEASETPVEVVLMRGGSLEHVPAGSHRVEVVAGGRKASAPVTIVEEGLASVELDLEVE